MKMPNAELAVVEMAKLRDYCLGVEHPRGRHKARVFAAALGLTAENSEELRDALLVAAQTDAAELGDQDEYGQRYALDFTMTHGARQAVVRSAWII
jgi:hypothetical protein